MQASACDGTTVPRGSDDRDGQHRVAFGRLATALPATSAPHRHRLVSAWLLLGLCCLCLAFAWPLHRLCIASAPPRIASTSPPHRLRTASASPPHCLCIASTSVPHHHSFTAAISFKTPHRATRDDAAHEDTTDRLSLSRCRDGRRRQHRHREPRGGRRPSAVRGDRAAFPDRDAVAARSDAHAAAPLDAAVHARRRAARDPGGRRRRRLYGAADLRHEARVADRCRRDAGHAARDVDADRGCRAARAADAARLGRRGACHVGRAVHHVRTRPRDAVDARAGRRCARARRRRVRSGVHSAEPAVDRTAAAADAVRRDVGARLRARADTGRVRMAGRRVGLDVWRCVGDRLLRTRADRTRLRMLVCGLGAHERHRGRAVHGGRAGVGRAVRGRAVRRRIDRDARRRHRARRGGVLVGATRRRDSSTKAAAQCHADPARPAQAAAE
ncbi:hypothetical protein FEP76_05966 [Burkholderia multivorans]|nr:hypothetical protein [Burkholderia multivorans]